MKNRVNFVENITSSDVNFERIETRFDQIDNTLENLTSAGDILV